MIQVQAFTCNPFQENSYVVYDQSGECIIIDPGFYNSGEQQWLISFLFEKKLRPVRLINTHCHIDHVLGNRFVAERFKLGLEAHAAELPVLKWSIQAALMYGLQYDPSPEPEVLLEAGSILTFGESELTILFTPGHSPGSVSLYSATGSFVIAGDVLFRESIGRTDLPGGDYDTLIDSIRRELFTLPDDTVVYNGHGSPTGIGYEKIHNPFLNRA